MIESYLYRLGIKTSQVVSILLTLAALQACGDVAVEEIAPRSQYLQASTAYLHQQDSYQVATKFVGKVIASQDANLGFEVAGMVNRVAVKAGEQVSKGQVLAELSTELLMIERAQLDAQLQQSQAEYGLTEANLQRLSSLSEHGFTSAQNLDELLARKKVLAASILGTRAALAASQYRIDKAKLIAPFAGVISRRHIAQGEVIAAGASAFRLLQSGHPEVTIGVPAAFISQLDGQQHQLDIAGSAYPVTLLTTGNELNSITRTISLRFALPVGSPVYNGQLAYLTLPQRYPQRGYWVPLSALTDGVRGMWNIYTLADSDNVADRDGADGADGAGVTGDSDLYQLVSTTVTVLHATADAAYVQGDLQDEQAYVASGMHRFVPGQLVKIASPASGSDSQHQANHLASKL